MSNQPDVYASTATFVVRPASVEGSEIVRAFDTLIRGVEINATYAAIARSELVKQRANRALDRLGIERHPSTVEAEVVTGTNIISISVRGEDPVGTAAYASALGEETVKVVEDLKDVFRLQPLDRPTVPTSPVGPNRRLTLVLFGVLGVAVAAFAVIGAEAWSRRVHRYPPLNVVDPRTGLPNSEYFRMRVREETLRSDVHLRPMSIGVMWLTRGDHTEGQVKAVAANDEDLTAMAEVLNGALPAVVVARLDRGFLGALMVESDATKARSALTEATGDGEIRRRGVDIRGRVCEYQEGRFTGDEEAIAAVAKILTNPPPARTDPGSVTP